MTFQRTAAEGPLLLADISGYTSFLTDVEVAHRHDAFANGAIPEAYGLMSSLLDGIVARVVPPFTLAKIEGDAVFAFATGDDAVPTGEALLECVRACYAEFSSRLAAASALAVPVTDAIPMSESYEHYSPIDTFAIPLH